MATSGMADGSYTFHPRATARGRAVRLVNEPVSRISNVSEHNWCKEYVMKIGFCPVFLHKK